MVKLVKMDEKVTFLDQMKDDSGAEIIKKQQPGFLALQLYRVIAGSCVFVNYAIWESIEHLKQTFKNPDLQSKTSEYPASTVAFPHLFKKVEVAGICVD
jgi:heme-degrading monooxygenase HmoA